MSLGSPFRLERQMFEPFEAAISFLRATSAATAFRVVREPHIGSCIPDLLIGEWSGTPPPVRRMGSNVARHICAFLETHLSADQRTLVNELHLTESGAHRALDTLLRARLVVENEAGEFQLLPNSRSDTIAITAIEMKLVRWRDALRQATAYLEFADRAYVVLDGHRVRLTAQMQEEFELSDVGLWLQCGDILGEVVRAVSNAPVTASRLMAIEKVTAGYAPE